jgi:hypothetical protein
MRRHVIAIAVGGTAVALTSNSSLAQRTPRPRTVDPTQSKLLDAEKQAQVKAFVRDYGRIVKDGPKLPKVDQALAVGELVPEDVALAALPQDSVTEVPQVTSYRFVLAANGAIAVVDPATRRVVQLIQP